MSSDINKIKSFLSRRQSYLKCGNHRISEALNNKYSLEDIKTAKKEVKKNIKTINNLPEIDLAENGKLKMEVLRMAEKLGMILVPKVEKVSDSIKQKSSRGKIPKPYVGGNKDNILVVGDLHEPFCLDEYLFFCREQQELNDCGTVIFIGDIIDNHYSSYHESDPDGFSAGQELDRAIFRVQDWYKVFPEGTVIIGNHDRLAYRKAYSGGVSKKWIRNYDDVLGTPNWDFVESIELFGINFNHGEGGTARTRMKNELQSQVQGHLHSQFYLEFLAGMNFIVFGMQVGCGVDREAYAMAYGKNYKKPLIGCGVVLDKGRLPMPIPMQM